MCLNAANPSRTRAPNSLFSATCSRPEIRPDSSSTTSRYNPCFRDKTVWKACAPSLISQSEMYDSMQRDIPFNTPPVNLVPRCASSTARQGFGFGSRRRVSNHSVYRIFAVMQSVARSSRRTHPRTQNKLRTLGHHDIRTPQMLVHLHPTKQEAGIQVEIHATQRVQFEITVDPTNLVSRQPGTS